MAHANPYTPGQVETLEQAQNELVKLAAVVNQIIANQKLLQRDDGCLMDCAVVPHTLSDEVVRMIGHFELLGAYTARPYQKGQVVTYQNRMYVCVAPHQGGAVMDTAAWRLIGKAGCGCEGGGGGEDGRWYPHFFGGKKYYYAGEGLNELDDFGVYTVITKWWGSQ